MAFPPGHFYSPVPDTTALATEEAGARIWPAEPREYPAIDWNGEAQLALLAELAAQQRMPLPRTSEDPQEYRLENGMFNGADAWFLQAMLRKLRPRRMIEVGCGFSSLLAARVNREYLGGQLDLTCIEPYPPSFLQGGVDGITRLLAKPVEAVPLDVYGELGAGDVLFIDSSHTVKTGNDVVLLIRDVIPRLAAGVVVHFHDVFTPLDYPPEWVLEGRTWNEQYLIEAFLAFNDSFEVLIAANWLRLLHPDEFAGAAPELAEVGGSSLWIRRRA